MQRAIESPSEDSSRITVNLKHLLKRVSESLKGSGRSPWDFSSYKLMPDNVRTELHSSGMTLGSQGVLALAQAPRWEPSAFYLFTKGLESNRVAQQDILRQAVVAEARPDSNGQQLRDIVTANIPLFPKDLRVQSDKLDQISRMGVDFWDEKFVELVDKLKTDHQGRDVYVLAYASLTGIRHLSRFSRETGRPLNLLVENWFEDPNELTVGYKIDGAKGQVDLLPRESPKSQDFVVVDDTVNKWAHLRRTWAFLTDQDPKTLVIDTARALVIDKASSDSSYKPEA